MKKHTTQNVFGKVVLNIVKAVTKNGYTKEKHYWLMHWAINLASMILSMNSNALAIGPAKSFYQTAGWIVTMKDVLVFVDWLLPVEFLEMNKVM